MKKLIKKNLNSILFRSFFYMLVTGVSVYFFLVFIYDHTEQETIKLLNYNLSNYSLRTILPAVVIGIFVGVFVGIRAIKPFNEVSDAALKIANGDFDVQIPISNEKGNSASKKMIKNFNLMTKKLSQIEELRNDFIANVSHEFKTPLATIQGYVSLLNDPNLTIEERDKYIKIIDDATKSLNNLVSNVLRLSKLENDGVALDISNFNVSEEIREVIILLEASWSKKNIEFDIDFDDFYLSNDENLLREVWHNIISNAIKYSYDNGIISIKIVKVNTEGLKVDIIDHGIGMTMEEQSHMFEKFYQADLSRNSNGNGLGLAMVKEILNLCQGQIEVQSEKGMGTMISIFVPNLKEGVNLKNE